MSSRFSGSGTGLLIVAAILGGGYWFLTQYDDMTILNRAGSHPVSDVLKDRAEAKPLSTMAKSIPRFIAARESVATRSQVAATGMWTYVVDTNRGSFTLADVILESSGDQAGMRIDRSFRQQWFRLLQQSGYFSVNRRPPPMRIRSFTITNPEGRRFTIAKDQNAAQLIVNLTAMLGCEEFEAAAPQLLTAERGSLTHAVVFSGLNEKLSLEEKLRLSCDANPQIRQNAAEMLASLLPRWPTSQMPGTFRASDYRGVIAQLSKQTSVDQKKRVFASLSSRRSATR